jgi:hypothetical protein
LAYIERYRGGDRWEELPMSGDTRANLAASLHSTAIDLSEVAAGLADASTDEGIGKLARILDRIAEEATDGAAILRALVARAS